MVLKPYLLVIIFIIVILHKFQISYANVNKESMNPASVRQHEFIQICFTNFAYDYLRNDDINFDIDLTLFNGTVSTKHVVVGDFQIQHIEKFCEFGAKLKLKDWSLFENGSLYSHIDKRYLNKSEYCFKLIVEDYTSYTVSTILEVCYSASEKLKSLEWTKTFVLVMSLSCLFVMTSLFCFILLSVHGKCFISYLGCLFFSNGISLYLTMDLTPYVNTCYMLGYLKYFLQLSHYVWLAIIIFIMWRDITSERYNTYYVRYIPFGWLVPMLITYLAYIAQESNIPEELKPGISYQYCDLIVHRSSAFIYLYGPCFLTLVFSLLISVMILRRVSEYNFLIRSMDLEFKCRNFFIQPLLVLMGLSGIIDLVSFMLILCKLNILGSFVELASVNQAMYMIFYLLYELKKEENRLQKKNKELFLEIIQA